MNRKKSDLLHSVDGIHKLDVKALNDFLTDTLTTNGVKVYITNGVYKQEIKDDYQDFDVFNIFRIRYIEETGNFHIFFNRRTDIADVLQTNREYAALMDRIVKVIDSLNNVLELVWKEDEIRTYNECKWYGRFYQFLSTHFGEVLLSLEFNTFYIKECGMEIKVVPIKNNSGLAHIYLDDNEMYISLDQFDEQTINILEKDLCEKQVIERLNAKTLSHTFATNENERSEVRKLLADRVKDIFYYDSSEELLECVEKSVKGPIFDIAYTTVRRVEVIKKDYFNFQLKYCKCDYGYFVFDWVGKKVSLYHSKEELLQHCIGFINMETSVNTW
ncbi:hypothetical protein [Bacillus sp. Brlt_9]|uniref:hypothetical protein n=1 Tax=Bacillus sp. Brlt_9 TaxID=3110916 RepID=UPI003F7BB1D9